MAKKIKVGIIGCGNILGQYIQGGRAFDVLEIIACADIDEQKAHAAAAEFAIPQVSSVSELLADPEVDLILNLTVPKAHFEVSLSVLEAGKHVYSEKPLATRRQDGQQIVATARERGLRIGCAPDTFLGGGIQTCRKLIDDGWIGQPIGATAFMMGSGPESWHPNPGFFYQPGAGPLFDMAPYYLTTLVQLLGPVSRVAGATRASFPERIATSKARFGERIPVAVPTHCNALLNFTGGPIAAMVMSFDVKASDLPRIEIYGAGGTLSVPDPNFFGGSVWIWRAGDGEWNEIPHTHSDKVGRGIGLADMAVGLLSGREHRANGDVAYHVLDIMEAVVESSDSNRHIQIESSCQRSAPLPMGLLPGRLDD
jgi:predicted dehydrogenase